jgi:hypothetical protein
MSSHAGTNGVEVTEARALVPIARDRTLDLAASGGLAQVLNDEFTILDLEIEAAQRQIARATQATVEGWVRLAIALIKMRESRAYLRAGYASYGEYLQQRHNISENTALRCTRSLEAFGQENFRALLSDVGMTRTYYLALIQEIDPAVFDDLMGRPPQNGRPAVSAMDVSDLEQIVADLKAQLAESYTHYEALADQLRAAKQITRTTGDRMAHIEKINMGLVVERDDAVRERDDLKKQLTRAPKPDPKQLRDLKVQKKDLQEQLAAANAALNLALSTPPPGVVQDVIAACDPALLAELMRFCVSALRRYRDLAPHVAPEQAQALTTVIAEIIGAGDLALLTPVITALAIALRRIHGAGAAPVNDVQALTAALDKLGAAAMPIYEQGRRDAQTR